MREAEIIKAAAIKNKRQTKMGASYKIKKQI